MIWLCYALCVLFLLDALRLRAKFRSLPVLPRSGNPPDADYVLLGAPGSAAAPETIAAAAEYAKSCNLELLDLIPGDAPALELMRMFFQRIDPARYRRSRIEPGHTSGYGLLASRELLDRAGVEKNAVNDVVDLYPLARMLKRYAADRAGIAVAIGFHAAPAENGTQRWRGLTRFMGHGANVFMVFQALVLLAMLSLLVVSVRGGLMVMAAYHIEVLLVFAGQKIRPRDLGRAILFRTVLDVRNLSTLILTRFLDNRSETMKIEEHRSKYTAELADGLERFFEKPREDCPVCGAHDLKPRIRTTDLFQHKPGRFTLDCCSACGHIFQNPRLSPAGLSFYYRDYYDGLGATDAEQLFLGDTESYLRRAQAVRQLAQPARWLDVGAGHGHFCCSAKTIFPDAEFDGLDLSCSIDEAVRLGWVRRGFRGLFPEIAPQLAGRYDVVSFFHYLEHVLEPVQEIRAARAVLAPDGLLVIEVPDPDCWYARVFQRFWMGWFQPQHLNLLSLKNLGRLLRQNGFEPVQPEGAYVQTQFDIIMATVLFLKWLAPKTGQPWQPRPTALHRLRRVIWIFGLPVLILAGLAELVYGPISRNLKIASAYCIIARRVDSSDPITPARLFAES